MKTVIDLEGPVDLEGVGKNSAVWSEHNQLYFIVQY